VTLGVLTQDRKLKMEILETWLDKGATRGQLVKSVGWFPIPECIGGFKSKG